VGQPTSEADDEIITPVIPDAPASVEEVESKVKLSKSVAELKEASEKVKKLVNNQD
jgi:Flp pilus assembly secretin CpaC